MTIQELEEKYFDGRIPKVNLSINEETVVSQVYIKVRTQKKNEIIVRVCGFKPVNDRVKEVLNLSENYVAIVEILPNHKPEVELDETVDEARIALISNDDEILEVIEPNAAIPKTEMIKNPSIFQDTVVPISLVDEDVEEVSNT